MSEAKEKKMAAVVEDLEDLAENVTPEVEDLLWDARDSVLDALNHYRAQGSLSTTEPGVTRDPQPEKKAGPKKGAAK